MLHNFITFYRVIVLENPTVVLHNFVALNIQAKFCVNWMSFCIWSTNLCFVYNFKVKKLEFLIVYDELVIDIRSSWYFASMECISG